MEDESYRLIKKFDTLKKGLFNDVSQNLSSKGLSLFKSLIKLAKKTNDVNLKSEESI